MAEWLARPVFPKDCPVRSKMAMLSLANGVKDSLSSFTLEVSSA